MTRLYTIFHGNLQFSSIPKNQYKTVVKNCYWPLVKILENNKSLKLGIEFSALTLLEIEKVDGNFINKIKSLIKEERLEFVGSSYTQAIFPLIPYEVNLKNLELGIEVYKEILGLVPKIFYVNEQTFSDGIISVYKKLNIENIVVDFDSTAERVRANTSLMASPIKIKSQGGQTINVVWNSSIAFQKFQRYIFDEISLADYHDYLAGHFSKIKNGSFCLYGGDWEVFGYSPKGIKRNYKDDFKRITRLLREFSEDKNIYFVLPSQLIKTPPVNSPTNITDFQDPILCKKQEKYNVSRWALAGKKTIYRNTDCYRLYKEIKDIKKSQNADKKEVESIETNLVRLWGSDYRTNTADDKNMEYDNLFLETKKMTRKYLALHGNFLIKSKVIDTKIPKVLLPEDGKVETESVKLALDYRKGATIKELAFPGISPKKICGLVPHGHFQNPKLSPDWLSAYCVFETDEGKKYTDLFPTKIFIDDKTDDDAIIAFTKIKIGICHIKKIYRVFKKEPRVDLQYCFNFKSVGFRSARIGSIAFNPLNLDTKTFWYSTINGGKNPELYNMNGKTIAQEGLISFRISSRGCLGATERWIAAGDKYKGVLVTWDNSEIASCPIVHFENTSQGLYGQIHHSIGESDETGYATFEGKINFSVSLKGFARFKH